jgi:hypothetical protein
MMRPTAWLIVAAIAGCPKAKDPKRAVADASPTPIADAAIEAAAPLPPPEPRPIGPYQIPFDGKRGVYYVVPKSRKTPARLLANLHGVCNPPGYACGYWVQSASERGFLVCPEGNSHCGPNGPPTWDQPFPKFDTDLERAIAEVDAHYPGEISREGAVLTGFSLGAYAAAHIARAHPGRWPYLILIEANVALDAADLRKAGVRAVAMIAGEIGNQAAGERQTVAKLEKQGFRAKYWVMKGAGHHYSGDIDTIMSEALDFVLADETDGGR